MFIVEFWVVLVTQNWIKSFLKMPLFLIQYFFLKNASIIVPTLVCIISCANKDLDGSLGPLGKFIEYCRIVAVLPVIPFGIMNNW